jgi:parallel beta-helix repeat protein
MSSDTTRKSNAPRCRKQLLTASIAAACLAFAVTPASALAVTCSKVAATGGSDSAAGTYAKPYRTLQKLADSLSAGQTGCLRSGTYSGNASLSRGGTAGAPLTITSYTGERATVVGKLWIKDSANFVTFSSLNLNGLNASNSSSPAVNGDDVAFVDNDVTNGDSAICFNLGATTYGRANRTLIQGNRIHDCGRLPATNLQHGIYVEHATGTRIVGNVIYDNADRGIQLYPDAQASYVARNVIDGNGEGLLIAGGAEDFGPQASSDNVIEQNVITNSLQRSNVESHWGSPLVGERNVVRQNCIFGGARDGQNHGLAPDVGFTSADNLFADPGFTSRAAKDFTLRSDSPCRDLASYHSPASAPAPAASGIVLSAPRSAVRPGKPIPIRGRIKGRKRPRRVVLRTRRGKHWSKVTTVRVKRNGHFKGHARIRKAHRSYTLQAAARGVGHSNTVRVTIRRR